MSLPNILVITVNGVVLLLTVMAAIRFRDVPPYQGQNSPPPHYPAPHKFVCSVFV